MDSHLPQEAEQDTTERIYDISYKKGFYYGWAQGWREMLCSSQTDDPHKNSPELSSSAVVVSSADAHGHDTEDNIEQDDTVALEDTSTEIYALSHEWAQFFARGVARRRVEAEAQYAGTDLRGTQEAETPGTAAVIDLGGLAAADIKRRAIELYGDRAEEVLCANAAWDAEYAAVISQVESPLWPAVSLAEIFITSRPA